jgi:hypothetical protein
MIAAMMILIEVTVMLPATAQGSGMSFTHEKREQESGRSPSSSLLSKITFMFAISL